MGGRERRGSRPLPACDLLRSPSVVVTLEEFHGRVRERVMEAIGAREGHRHGGNHQSCSLVLLFSKTALEEPFPAAEGVY